tara:strand:+ start:968 stop:1549 length:582 start_codon:yes stop_codon:yes gene_type:complete
MEQASLSMTAMAMGEQPGDDSLLVRFFLHAVHNVDKSEVEGRPIFEEKEHVEIKSPGNRKSGVARVARPRDIERFPRHYAAFKNRIGDVEDGTPISEWTMIPRSLVEEFAYFNIRTIESLAAVTDGNAMSHSGIHKWRTKARAWLERAAEEADGQAIEAMKSENEELKKRIEELGSQVSALVMSQAEASVEES